MWEAKRRYDVSLLDYIITSNHVHILLSAMDGCQISGFMQYISSLSARDFNRRKEMTGALWEGRYRSTLIQDGIHLGRCLFYIDMNMVRAVGLRHPVEWKWSGHHELVGRRRRYRMLDKDKLLGKICCGSEEQFREWYDATLDEKLRQREMSRESFWSEARAVGDYEFVLNQAKRKDKKHIVETGCGLCYF
jgi:putative transposase